MGGGELRCCDEAGPTDSLAPKGTTQLRGEVASPPAGGEAKGQNSE